MRPRTIYILTSILRLFLVASHTVCASSSQVEPITRQQVDAKDHIVGAEPVYPIACIASNTTESLFRILSSFDGSPQLHTYYRAQDLRQSLYQAVYVASTDCLSTTRTSWHLLRSLHQLRNGDNTRQAEHQAKIQEQQVVRILCEESARKRRLTGFLVQLSSRLGTLQSAVNDDFKLADTLPYLGDLERVKKFTEERGGNNLDQLVAQKAQLAPTLITIIPLLETAAEQAAIHDKHAQLICDGVSRMVTLPFVSHQAYEESLSELLPALPQWTTTWHSW